ncbi:NTF2 export protein 2 [Fasciola hepatica]|uniref:NTF2-related export protein n=1 Tax=Fasciola hepatica TaxID=6192 RepID=A0A2H1C2Y8_FASHE|nr:NTF2 export protein 2 [Fasciola hepatica]
MSQSCKLDEAEVEQWKVASEAGEKFSTLYYCAFDKPNRPDLPGFFMDNVVLIWNGNRVETQPSVVEFLNKLPRCTTNLHSLSAQPVHKSVSGERLLILVNTLGTIKFEQHPVRLFSETFFLTQDNSLWRVQSVTFRFMD